jgi:hypothetical protein
LWGRNRIDVGGQGKNYQKAFAHWFSKLNCAASVRIAKNAAQGRTKYCHHGRIDQAKWNVWNFHVDIRADPGGIGHRVFVWTGLNQTKIVSGCPRFVATREAYGERL